jgi:hypothetical protein
MMGPDQAVGRVVLEVDEGLLRLLEQLDGFSPVRVFLLAGGAVAAFQFDVAQFVDDPGDVGVENRIGVALLGEIDL